MSTGGGVIKSESTKPPLNSHRRSGGGSDEGGGGGGGEFHMPLHYPKYTKAEYETMPEWRLDCLLQQYGLPLSGDLHHKRLFAIGAFLWP